MRVAVKGRPFLASSSRIIHLGRNPVKGGSPPRERRRRGKVAVRVGVLAQDVERPLIVVEEVVFRVKKAVVVMKRYITRARAVKEGAN